MFKGRKFKKAEKEFARHAKTFNRFCVENDIEVIKSIEGKPSKRKIWLGLTTATAVAVAVVCSCIPLMRQNTGSERFYSDGEVALNRIDIGDITDDNVQLLNDEFLMEYSFVYRILTKDDDNVLLGYNVIGAVCYTEIEDTSYLFEVDYIIQTDKHYNFKDRVLFNECKTVISKSNIDYRYNFSENKDDIGAYMTYKYNGYDYFIKFYETDYTTVLNDESIEVFVNIAFDAEANKDGDNV